MTVAVQSFSYRHGLPEGVDGFVFDCRSLPNPYWDESLRKYTGRDEPVRAFMDAHKGEVKAFLGPVEELLRNVLAAVEESGRERLHVAFGCTGGQHRSVYSAQHLAEHIHNKFGIEVHVCHREQNITQVMEANV